MPRLVQKLVERVALDGLETGVAAIAFIDALIYVGMRKAGVVPARPVHGSRFPGKMPVEVPP